MMLPLLLLALNILPKVAAPDPYAGKLTDLDVDKDGKVQMYRKMGQEERDKVVQNGKLQPNEPNRQSGEVWLTTSAKHSRVFHNKGVGKAQEYVIAFTVNIKKLEKEFENLLIPQANSGAINAGKEPAQLKNLFNEERLRDHPYAKFNIGVKGEFNVRRFNRAVDSITEYKVLSNGKIVNAQTNKELESETSDTDE